MICEHSLFPTRKVQGEVDGFTLLEAAGYVKTLSPGCTALLPLGSRSLAKISQALRGIYHDHGFNEVSLPLLQKYDLWEESGRAAKYPGLLCETMVGEKRFVINPTQEEAVLDLFRICDFRTKDLPVRVFHIGERLRNEKRPAHGLIRSRSFTLLDAYALTRNSQECELAALDLERVMDEIIAWTALPVQRGMYFPSTMGVPTYSYWVPSVTKQCIVPQCTSCGASFRVKIALECCPHCGESALVMIEAAELGDVMRSGDILSSVMQITPTHSREPLHVAMMGLGVSRLLQLIAEYNHDDRGLMLPYRVAPFAVHIVADAARSVDARELYDTVRREGYEVLLDLRDESIGRRLIDADLIGAPVAVLFGKKTRTGVFEARRRQDDEFSAMSIEQLLNILKEVANE